MSINKLVKKSNVKWVHHTFFAYKLMGCNKLQPIWLHATKGYLNTSDYIDYYYKDQNVNVNSINLKNNLNLNTFNPFYSFVFISKERENWKKTKFS